MWLNEHEIETAEHRYSDEPVMGPATRTLRSLMDGVNRCSDGWPYWQSPSRAAQQLQNLITEHQHWERTGGQQGTEATAAMLGRAYTQLRRFRSGRGKRAGCEFRLYPADGVTNADPKAAPRLEPVPVTVKLTADHRVKMIIDWPEGDIPPGRYEGYVVAVEED